MTITGAISCTAPHMCDRFQDIANIMQSPVLPLTRFLPMQDNAEILQHELKKSCGFALVLQVTILTKEYRRLQSKIIIFN